jgi:hypothetical protein
LTPKKLSVIIFSTEKEVIKKFMSKNISEVTAT